MFVPSSYPWEVFSPPTKFIQHPEVLGFRVSRSKASPRPVLFQNTRQNSSRQITANLFSNLSGVILAEWLLPTPKAARPISVWQLNMM